ncbi:MAG: hypothetical protein WA775_02755 [Psychroserpens sp.]|uniref:hypothetical protein n=1 Tax=Psychroserpens sp. TaxID=2020870 RepID=UPI003C78A717
MKTSLLFIILIIINTTAIVSQPITNLIQGINIWWFLGLEICLVIGYFINKALKELQTHCEIDCNNLKLFIVRVKPDTK